MIGDRDYAPSVDLYFDDFLVGIYKLTPVQRGIYITICLETWARHGPLEDDDR